VICGSVNNNVTQEDWTET